MNGYQTILCQNCGHPAESHVTYPARFPHDDAATCHICRTCPAWKPYRDTPEAMGALADIASIASIVGTGAVDTTCVPCATCRSEWGEIAELAAPYHDPDSARPEREHGTEARSPEARAWVETAATFARNADYYKDQRTQAAGILIRALQSAQHAQWCAIKQGVDVDPSMDWCTCWRREAVQFVERCRRVEPDTDTELWDNGHSDPIDDGETDA